MNLFSLAFYRNRSERMLRAVGRIVLALTALLALGMNSPSAHAQDYNEQVLTSFDGDAGSDGACPYNGLVFVNSTLYGTTSGGYFHGNNGQYGGSGNINSGYGTVFSIHTTGTGFQTLHTFGTGSDGQYPYGRLLPFNGLLYGTTLQGGALGRGTVFSIDPSSGTEKVLYSFGGTPTDGINPIGGLIVFNKVLYGTTTRGATSQDGTVFAINPDGSGYKTLYRFTGTNGDGANPSAALIVVSGFLYGTTAYGGSSGDGTIFSINLTTNTETVLHSFAGVNGDGATPLGDLLSANGKLYGTTIAGGNTNSGNTAGYGTVFSVNPNGTGYLTMYKFSVADGTPQFPPVGVNTDGALPISGLNLVNGLLYGTTTGGGSRGVGTLFFIDPATNTETTLCELQGANDPPGAMTPGGAPSGDLLNINGVLYTTCYAGAGGFGLGDGSVIALSTGVVAPAAKSDTYTPNYKTAYSVAAPGVLANDNNGGSNNVTADLVTNVKHGTLIFNSDGSFIYTSAAGYSGSDSFTYQAVNSGGKSGTATVTLNIQPVLPTAVNNSNLVKYETALPVRTPGVLGNDDNGGSAKLTATLVTTVSHGKLNFNNDGSFTYTPALGFVGTDSFSYQAVNTVGSSNTATATLTVQATTPTAHDDHGKANYNTTLNISAPGILGNDDNGGKGPITATLATNVTHGTLTLNSDGSFIYIPTKGFVGTDSFTYQVANSLGTGTTATCTLTVAPVAPIAVNNSNNVTKNTTLTVNAPGVLGNDDNGGSSPMTAALVSNVSHGTLTLNSNGAFTYTPAAGFTGTDSFTYQAVNAVGMSNIATATLIVK